MPELPEVQTTVSGLNKFLPGLKIRDVWSDWKKSIKTPKSFAGFKKEIISEKIIKAERSGDIKIIIKFIKEQESRV